jgi:hypothetical protein
MSRRSIDEGGLTSPECSYHVGAFAFMPLQRSISEPLAVDFAGERRTHSICS